MIYSPFDIVEVPFPFSDVPPLLGYLFAQHFTP